MGNYSESHQYKIQTVNTQCGLLTCPIESKGWGFNHAWPKPKQFGQIRYIYEF